jgi:hypothetical protein
VWFYRIDPERVLHIPLYLLEILIQHLPALDAEHLYNQIVSASSPNMEQDDRKELLESLEETMEPLRPVQVALPTVQIIEQNPDKAREYFEMMGIHTK